MDNYLFAACANYSYSIDQGLAMLCWNKHDLQASLIRMKEYKPKCVEWSEEDKILFEQAFMYHGKNFNKIRHVVKK